MSDLRARFRSLDAIPADHVWPAVERRVEELDRTGRVRPVIVRKAGAATPRAGSLRRSLAIAAVLILGAIASIGTALLVGSGQERRVVVTPEPTTGLPAVIDCDVARAASDRRVTGWTAGSRPGPAGAAQNGWIAVWNTDAIPEVVLVHPGTGARCALVRFPDLARPLAESRAYGSLAWSPDGSALAIMATAGNPLEQLLYVWSKDGLAGPIAVDSYLIVAPMWSPDGSRVAVLEQPNIRQPERSARVKVVASDGAVTDLIPDCNLCLGGSVVWAPDSRRLAVQIMKDRIEPLGVGVGSVDDDVIRVLPATAPLGSGAVLVDWIGDRVIVLTDERLDNRLLGLSVLADGSQDLGPSGLTGLPAILGRSPDRSTWAAHLDDGIVLIPVGGGRRTTIARFDEFTQLGWAPDGGSVAYLRHGDDEGLWAGPVDGGETRRIAPGDFGASVEAGWPDTLAWQPVWTAPR